MSKQIDERVVSMHFDNRNFEKNVSTTLSTLDKLKQKLNFTGSAKGLENIATATKNVKMDGLAKGVETVRAKFSALEVVGVTALANIANSAVNAGKRMVKALTIDPISSGFSEYEMMLNTVQTTMSATGKTAKEVEDELKRLDDYADKTVYSTADMLNNLPKFTNAGVELEKATTAMIGIANATALAGGDASKASIAFYNLGQAIGTGYLTRMDYNSINNAGIATMEWKNQMVEAAIAQKTLTKVGEDAYKAGGKTYTLQQLFIDGLQQQWATTDVMMKVFGDYGDETTEIGKKSYAAAQDIKTFTQMMESLKATAGTGWKDTWQLIFGDLDGAKKLWTGLSEFISGVITKMTKFRNGILESALGKGFTKLGEKINAIVKPVNKTVDTVKDAVQSLKSYTEIVDEIIAGKWGNGQSRWDKLSESGYDWAHAQNLVNEKLGVSLRRTTKYKEAQTETAKTTADLTEKEAIRIAQLAKMSDAELKTLGYTDKQIEAFRELAEAADKIGLPLEEFIQKIDEIDGRWLLTNSFKNIGDAMSQFATVVGEAWKSIFPVTMDSIADSLFNIISAFHKFTTYLGGFVDESGNLTESGENLKRTFEGIFAAIDIAVTLVSGPLGWTFRLLKEILSAFDVDVLSITARIGDAIVAFRDWLDSVLDFSKIADKLVPIIRNIIDFVKNLGSEFKNSKFYEIGSNIISGLANGIKNGAQTIWNAIVALAKGVLEKICSVLGIHSPSRETYAIGENVVQGLANGIQNGSGAIWTAIQAFCSTIIEAFKNFNWQQISDFLWIVASFFPSSKIIPIIRAFANFAKNCGETLIDSFKEVLGINSPSKKFFELGGDIIAGLVNGLKNGLSTVWNTIKDIASNIANFFKKVDFGAVFAGGIAIAALVLMNKMLNIVDKFAGIGSFFDNLGEGINKNLKASALEKKSKALLNLALAIGILAGSLAILTYLAVKEPGALKQSIAAIVILAGVIALLAFAVDKLTTSSMDLNAKEGTFKKTGSAIASLLGVAASLLIVAAAVKLISTIDAGQLKTSMLTMAGIITGMIVLMGAMALFNKKGVGSSLGDAGTMLFKMSAALLIMVVVIKMAAKLKPDDVAKGLAFVAAVELLFIGIVAVSKFAGKHAAKAGGMLLLMSLAFVIMIRVVKQAAKLEKGTVSKAIGVLGLVGALFAALIAVSTIAGANAVKAGAMLLLMAGAFWIMVHVIELIAGLDDGTIARSLKVISGIGIIFTALVAVSNIAGTNAAKAGAMLMTASGALLILVGAMFILSYMLKNNEDGVWRSLAVIAVLETLFAGLIAVSKLAENSKASLITLTIMITLILGVVIGLTFIKDTDKLKSSVSAVSAILIAFATLVAATSKLGNPKLTSLIGLVAIVGLLGLVVWGISKLKIGNSIETVTAISILLISMSAALVVLGAVKTVSAKALGAIAAMALVVAELAVVLKLVSDLDISVSMGTVAALSVLLVAMSGALILLGVAGSFGVAALIGVGVLAVLIAALFGIIVGLGALAEHWDNCENFIDKGIPILEKIGYALGSFVGNVIGGLLSGITGGVLSGLAIELSNFMTNLEPFLEGLGKLDENMLGGVKTLAETILILSAANFIDGLSSLSFLTGDSSLADFGLQLAGFATGLVAFAESVSVLDESHLNAMNIAAQAGKALAEMAAAIPNSGGLWGKIAGENDAGSFGTQIEAFGKSLIAFGKSVQGIDVYEAAIKASVSATKGIVEVANAIPNSGGLWAKIAGDNTMDGFGTQVEGFGKSLIAYGKSVLGIDQYEKSIKSSAKAVEGLVEVANAIPNSGGLWAKIAGDNTISGFGTQLATFGNGLKSYGVSVSGIDGYVNSIKTSKDVTSVMIEIANKIRNELSFDWGDSEITKLGNGLASFGKGIATFSASAANIGNMNVLKNIVVAAVDMVNYAKNNIDWDAGASEITKLGSNIAAFGKNIWTLGAGIANIKDLSSMKTTVQYAVGMVNYAKANLAADSFAMFTTLGSNVASFGKNIATFGKNLTGMGDISSANSTVETLVNIVSKVKNSFSDGDSGSTGLSIFGSQIATFGKNLKTFGTNLSKAGDVSSAVSTVETVITMANKVKYGFGSDDGSLNNAGENIKSFGKSLAKFAKEIKNVKVGDMLSIKVAIDGVVISATKLNDLNFSGLDTFGEKLGNIGTKDIDTFVKAFKNSGPKIQEAVKSMLHKITTTITVSLTDFTLQGSKLTTALAKGMISKSSEIKASIIKTVNTAIMSIRSGYTGFYNAGKYVVDGFAAGISANTFKAKAKAVAMAEAALQAAKEALKINSPSKVFRAIGMSVPEGFAMGIGKLTNVVKSASVGMTDVALDGVKNSISRISDIISSDIDAQPTIRPVVDLSNVRSSASLVSGMFDMNPSVGVMANASSINKMMSRRQNGANDDVVSAIGDLKKSINDNPSNVYNFGDVAYGDESAISNAVQSLVRAIMVERRV